jgi:hypothetical protein
VTDEEDVLVDLYGVPPQRWPEAPTDTGVVLYGGKPLHTSPRSRRSRAR